MDFEDIEKRLSEGKQLNHFDEEAVETVAGLIRQIREARLMIGERGVLQVNDLGQVVENPAAAVERRASAELRGWVKDRPDLFGQQTEKKNKGNGLRALKVVD